MAAAPDAPPAIRGATPQDAEAIRAIYAHHVLHGVGTFEEEPPDLAEITERMGHGHWLVADDGERVLGYAYYAPYRPRSAYRYTVEDSIYVHPDAVGRGVGSALLGVLVRDARTAGLRTVVAAIGGGEDNAGSVAVHRRHGFTDSGVLTGVGVKFGRRLDVAFLQLDL